MGLINNIKNYRDYKKVAELLEPVENENEKEKAKRQLNEILEKHPDLREYVLKFAKESNQIENQVIAQTVLEKTVDLVNKPKIDEEEKNLLKVGVEFIGEKGEDFPDKYLEEVANAAGNSKHIDREKELKVIGQIDDKEKQQSQIAKILKRIYTRMNSKTNENELVREIRELRKVVESCKKISDWERKIVSKQIAYDYINYGNVFFKTLSEIMPITRMFNTNIPKTVETEYNEITRKIRENEKEDNIKIGKYSQEHLRMRLLDEMAKQIAYRYTKTKQFPRINTSEELKKISQEEEEYFISKINIYAKNNLSEEQLNSLRGDIRGTNEELVKIEEITEIINEQPLAKRKESINQVKDFIQNEEIMKLLKVIKSTGLDKSFEGMEEKDIEDRLKVLQEIVDKRKEEKEKPQKTGNAHTDQTDDDGEISL